MTAARAPALQLACETDGGAPHRATLGLIVLGPDETIEADFCRLLPAGAVRLLHSRIPSAPEVTADTLPRMAADLPGAAALLPAGAGLNAIGYACTSGATVMGSGEVARLIAGVHPGVPVSDPLSAVLAACRALGVRRVGVVSPYVPAVSDALVTALEAAGLTLAALGSFGIAQEATVVRITPRSIAAALRRIADAPGCEAIFVSCTNLRALEVLAAAEFELGKPVLASNQVLAWHLLRLAGIAEGPEGAGRLATCPLSAE